MRGIAGKKTQRFKVFEKLRPKFQEGFLKDATGNPIQIEERKSIAFLSLEICKDFAAHLRTCSSLEKNPSDAPTGSGQIARARQELGDRSYN